MYTILRIFSLLPSRPRPPCTLHVRCLPFSRVFSILQPNLLILLLLLLPGLSPTALVCNNGNCRARLSQLLVQCQKCQLTNYCSRDCQKQAWKAGHSSACGQGTLVEKVKGTYPARKGITTELTDEQSKIMGKLQELYDAQDWRGLICLMATAMAAADQLRVTWPDLAAWVYRILGRSLLEQGPHQFATAIRQLEQARLIAAEAGDKSGEGSACIMLGSCLCNLQQFSKAIGPSERALAIAQELGDRCGQGSACANLGNCYFFVAQVNFSALFNLLHEILQSFLTPLAEVTP